MKKEQITQGFSWATSHLEFIGSLARPEDMRKRLNNMAKLADTQNIGFANMYTTLGRAVDAQDKSSWTGKVVGTDRTFCNLPKGELKKFFSPAVNDKAEAETWAHMSMFEPKKNPGYYSMSEQAKETIIDWASNEWYEESTGPNKGVGFEGVAEMVQKPEEPPEEEFEDVKRPASSEPWKEEL